MKFEKKQVYYVVFAFIICYAIQAYWHSGAALVDTIYQASIPFMIGAGIAYIVNIVMSAYESLYDRFLTHPILQKIKRSITMILAYLTFIFVIFWLFSIVLPDLIVSINSLLRIDTSGFSHFIKEISDNRVIKESLNYFGSLSDITTTLSDYSRQFLNQVLSVLTGVLTSVSTIASTVLNIFVSLVFSIYILASKEELGRQFNVLMDTYISKYADGIRYVFGILHLRFHGFFVGQTIEAVILGTLTTLGMFLLDFPYAATIGILVAFFSLIPIVGAYIGATIGFILIATHSVSQAFFFLIYLVILQQFEGNVIYPRVVGGSIGLPGMWVLMAITIGGALWGVLGMIVAVPIAASLYQMIKDNVAKRQQAQSNNLE
ncbi:AI-2E family transporter [Streptococcus alactolyticus]|uniref:AI-2E family transporter n=1 Tax=Streptococcus alactolyticus TaxID=29389 RepID=UPI001F33C50E|nr:AI-2E family transporter [Streptococcus alactolyticus]MCF2666188.1 AI-2E family transporter [Streptococcus alactolyticus]MDD7362181.1 AI-2E family transporter [Streptococcus alactolyticus]